MFVEFGQDSSIHFALVLHRSAKTGSSSRFDALAGYTEDSGILINLTDPLQCEKDELFKIEGE